MRPPLVSVVVPTHGRAAMLPRLLASVLRQDVADLELLVVDDGSPDETQDVLARCADPRLRVLRHERPRGVAHARNTGTAAARGRWVAWCDDDDVWDPAKLRLQLAALAAAPGALWSNGGSVYVDSDLHLTRVRRCPRPETVLADLLRVNVVTGGGSGVLADRELALSLGGFDPALSMYADWDLWARLAAAAPLAVVDRPLVGYVEHDGGMSRGRLDLALSELDLLAASLDRIGAAAGLTERLDRLMLGQWVRRQQNGGRRWDNVLLPFRLLPHGLVEPSRAVPYALAGGLAPQVLQRRWARRWLLDEQYVAYAHRWLAEARRDLPPLPRRLAPAATSAEGREVAGRPEPLSASG
ncbi:MAG: glycosyltransferase [Actinomycetota bacterium]|nr:glycosyltransferase [Actinomycetota bacterium]